MRPTALPLLAVALLAILPAPSNAAPQKFAFTAVIESLDDPAALLAPSPAPGQTISGRFRFDPALSSDERPGTRVGDYAFTSAAAILAEIGPLIFRSGTAACDIRVQVLDNQKTAADARRDAFAFHSYLNDPVAPGVLTETISLQFDDRASSAVSTDALPTGGLGPGRWPHGMGLVIRGCSAADESARFTLRARITSVAKTE